MQYRAAPHSDSVAQPRYSQLRYAARCSNVQFDIATRTAPDNASVAHSCRSQLRHAARCSNVQFDAATNTPSVRHVRHALRRALFINESMHLSLFAAPSDNEPRNRYVRSTASGRRRRNTTPNHAAQREYVILNIHLTAGRRRYRPRKEADAVLCCERCRPQVLSLAAPVTAAPVTAAPVTAHRYHRRPQLCTLVSVADYERQPRRADGGLVGDEPAEM